MRQKGRAPIRRGRKQWIDGAPIASMMTWLDLWERSVSQELCWYKVTPSQSNVDRSMKGFHSPESDARRRDVDRKTLDYL